MLGMYYVLVLAEVGYTTFKHCLPGPLFSCKNVLNKPQTFVVKSQFLVHTQEHLLFTSSFVSRWIPCRQTIMGCTTIPTEDFKQNNNKLGTSMC